MELEAVPPPVPEGNLKVPPPQGPPPLPEGVPLPPTLPGYDYYSSYYYGQYAAAAGYPGYAAAYDPSSYYAAAAAAAAASTAAPLPSAPAPTPAPAPAPKPPPAPAPKPSPPKPTPAPSAPAPPLPASTPPASTGQAAAPAPTSAPAPAAPAQPGPSPSKSAASAPNKPSAVRGTCISCLYVKICMTTLTASSLQGTRQKQPAVHSHATRADFARPKWASAATARICGGSSSCCSCSYSTQCNYHAASPHTASAGAACG